MRGKVHLKVDASFFAKFCIVCYQDEYSGYTQLIRFTDGEHYKEIRKDLEYLIRLGIQIESITTDEHKSILKAIKKFSYLKNHLDLHRGLSIKHRINFIKWDIYFTNQE